MALKKLSAAEIVATSVLVASVAAATVASVLLVTNRPAELDIDQRKVVELNKVLTDDESKNGKNLVVGEAIGDFTLNKVTSYLPKLNSNTFYWTEADNRVVIVSKNKGVTYPDEFKVKYEAIKETSIPATWHNLEDGCDHYWDLNSNEDYECDYCHEVEKNTPVLNETVSYDAKPGDNVQVEDFGGGKHSELNIDSLACKYTFNSVDTYESAEEKGLSDYYVDFLVSFYRKDNNYSLNDQNEKVAAKKGSLGLWGSYSDYEVAFYLPYDMAAHEKTGLISLTDTYRFWNYAAIVSIVNSFSCGAFNCSPENEGLTMKVELCMWERSLVEDTEKPLASIAPTYLVETYEYTFTSEVNVSEK